MDLDEAGAVLGAMVDHYGTGEESEAAGIVFAALDAARATIAEQAAEIERLHHVERRAEASTRSNRGAVPRATARYILTGEKTHWSKPAPTRKDDR